MLQPYFQHAAAACMRACIFVEIVSNLTTSKLCFTSCIRTDLALIETELQSLTLIEIEKLMQENRRTLKDFSLIPYPYTYVL